MGIASAVDTTDPPIYYIHYQNGMEVDTSVPSTTPTTRSSTRGGGTVRGRDPILASANATLDRANAIFLAIQQMGNQVKTNIDAVLADLTAIQTNGLSLDRGNKTLVDARAVIQNGLLLTTQVQSLFGSNASASVAIQNDPTNVAADVVATKQAMDNLLRDVQVIGKAGFSVAAAATVVADVQSAVQTGLVAAKDGVDIINSIQHVISDVGVSLQDGQALATTIQSALTRGLAAYDMHPKVCRRQASWRGNQVSPLVNQCLPTTEDTFGPLCLPKCRPGYEPIDFDMCRKVGCSGAVGVSDLGIWCTKPAAYTRPGHAIWDQAKCNAEVVAATGGANPSCEKCAFMWFPPCKSGFHAIGCFICTPDCPVGTTDDGAFCRKDAYFRGISISRLGCPTGKEQSLLLCYPPCGPNQDGAGPLCSPQCPSDAPVACGLFCASSTATCAASVVAVVGTGARMALSAVASDFSGVLSSAVQLGTAYVTMAPCSSRR
ncbi:Aste57867_21352 [Aphanomyces stellatus]|uniref:Aste57867_21352 protein n=1 Tax=Aphanomyces stellatus TaxID=120398 RepID=A0A485LJD5_9STRA|nr:hypothetical protein As57867_021283 [Aphanomyces stellatus]VFT98024.1 Aste57867_21352 [Aphanomyces stellatus]